MKHKIYVTREKRSLGHPETAALIKKAAAAALKSEGIGEPCEIGVTLTEHGMMQPHASVSGLMIAHPLAHYFSIPRIGEDQLRSYARRRGVPEPIMRRFLQSILAN